MANTALILDRDYNNKMNIYSVTKIALLVYDLINIELVICSTILCTNIWECVNVGTR